MKLGNIAKDGYKYFTFFILTGIILIGMYIKTNVFQYMIILIFGSIFIFLSIFSLYFFRNPIRNRDYEKNEIISPADGKVVKIDTLDDNDIGSSCIRVCIFMNVFNVHINRNPIGGIVKKVEYSPGKFLNASYDNASFENERNSVLIENGSKKLKVVQIAGLIARRIRCFVSEGSEIVIGDYLGLIQFGSRLDVYMPKNTLIKVKKGDKVKAGLDTIGVFNE
ncbi:MAG: phosphatidylserine decarboxylase family protein [Candidatus Muiribacterium halophilum]|uniref:Phosphatidylserine decarboxylase proenzyme n=1 Tax=Muiribacterium halophilum TaxID=2053465 RepID=A0A2N5ZBZ0_MUIH1|nr:MAG: phosphatidylserine decarboxylase family protein [Candidatus Muirbacterium halophilum]